MTAPKQRVSRNGPVTLVDPQSVWEHLKPRFARASHSPRLLSIVADARRKLRVYMLGNDNDGVDFARWQIDPGATHPHPLPALPKHNCQTS
jgi:hypothetical protein